MEAATEQEPGTVPLVVRGTRLSDETAQTANISRFTAFDRSTIGDQGVWVGKAVTAPGSVSDKHHHAEACTIAYIIRGRARVYWGEGLAEYVEAGPGDFIYVPPHIHHVEQNVGDEPGDVVFVRVPDNIVVNIGPPGPDERRVIDSA